MLKRALIALSLFLIRNTTPLAYYGSTVWSGYVNQGLA
jgi:hypothetical protein